MHMQRENRITNRGLKHPKPMVVGYHHFRKHPNTPHLLFLDSGTWNFQTHRFLTFNWQLGFVKKASPLVGYAKRDDQRSRFELKRNVMNSE